jgi:hypothetical protein
MKRFHRWVLNGLVALSLLLCLATPVLWYRGFHVRDGFYWVTPGQSRQFGLNSDEGQIAFFFMYVATSKEHLLSAPGFHNEASKPTNLYTLGWPVDFNLHGLGFLIKRFRSLLTSQPVTRGSSDGTSLHSPAGSYCLRFQSLLRRG